ncbi:hypothetical protein Tco_1161288, partial [Tanacetum coccineum]
NNNSGASRLGFFTCILLLGLLWTSLDVLDQTLDSVDGEAMDDMEKLGDELARIGLGLRCCLVHMMPRLNLVPKKVMWPLGSQVGSLRYLCAT